MTEVTVDNFDDLFSQIANEISNCSFVSFELQLTGRHLDQNLHPSTDDVPKTRYRKLRQSVVAFLPCQFGLSIFRRRQHQNGFKCCVYTFYLFPRFYDYRQARVFSVHSATAELLQAHGFDFGRMFSQGISFMNDEEEFQLRQRLGGNNSVTSAVESNLQSSKEKNDHTASIPLHPPRIPSPPPLNSHEQTLDELIRQVVTWISTLPPEPLVQTRTTSTTTSSSSSSTVFIPPSTSASTRLKYAPLPNELHNYLLIRHLRKCFPDLWIELDPVDECALVVCRVNAQERRDLESDAFKFENEIIVAHLVGFSRLFKTLVEAKKPLIGYEMLLPLLHCFQHFLHPMPDELSEFCQTLVDAFPHIYDVKRLYYSISRTQLPHCEKFFSSGQSLEQLLAVLQSADFRSHLPNEPEILCLDQDSTTIGIIGQKSNMVKFHDPGQIAYATGVAFIKLAHLLMMNKLPQMIPSNEGPLQQPSQGSWLTFEHLLEAIAISRNKVQWSKSELKYLDLGIVEPISELGASSDSAWLCVRCRRYERPLRLEQLQKRLAQIDMEGLSSVKRTAANEALIELDNEIAAEKLLQQLRSDREYSVHLYKPPQLRNKWTNQWTVMAALSSTLVVTLLTILITKKCLKN